MAQLEETTQQPQLTVMDMRLLVNIVDLASRRGAFHAAELSQVGEVFNKLNAFVVFTEEAQQESTTGETE